MNMTLSITPLISLLAGILILVMPRLLNFIVAIYLIIIGVLGLFGAGNLRFKITLEHEGIHPLPPPSMACFRSL